MTANSMYGCLGFSSS
ncbi:MAG: hypothetical protein IPK55_12905 [Streptococcus sp.]|nr:hypothetical protein [Streptococcus sp.]